MVSMDCSVYGLEEPGDSIPSFFLYFLKIKFKKIRILFFCFFEN